MLVGREREEKIERLAAAHVLAVDVDAKWPGESTATEGELVLAAPLAVMQSRHHGRCLLPKIAILGDFRYPPVGIEGSHEHCSKFLG